MVAIILIIATVVTIYAICKHNKLRALVIYYQCIAQFYIILALSIIIIVLVVFMILQVRRIKLSRGQLFSNIVKIMLFISDVQYYIPVKLSMTAGSIHLFKLTGKLMIDKVRLNKHYIWDILEIDWSEVKVTFNGKVINLPKSIPVKIWDKFKVSHMINSQPILFHLMLKQVFNWFTLTLKEQEIDNV